MTDRTKTAYDLWLQLQQEQEQQRAPSPGEFVGSPRNFLPPEQRRTFVVPAGIPGAGAEDPFPDRQTAHDRRLQQAQLAKAIEQESRLSGSGHVSNPRAAAQQGWRPELVRDPSGLHTRWVRDDGDRQQVV